MRKFWLLALLLFAPLIAHAQAGRTAASIVIVASKANPCSTSFTIYSIADGDFFGCKAGSWTSMTTGLGGTVTSFSAGTLSPLFTTSVANASTTPALSFSLSNAAAFTLFANNTNGATTPSYTTMDSIFGSCSAGTNALTFDTTTHAFGCNTITGTIAGTVSSPFVPYASGANTLADTIMTYNPGDDTLNITDSSFTSSGRGLNVVVTTTSANEFSLRAGVFSATWNGAGVADNLEGIHATAELRAGSLDSDMAAIVTTTLVANVNASTAIGIKIAPVTVSAGGSVTNGYGLQVLNQDQATNNWALKTGLGQNTLGDRLGLGADPGASIMLDVQGGAALSPTVYSPVGGAGPDDATFGGTPTTFANFLVEIDANGAPDTFTWAKDFQTQAAGVAITGAAQALSDGVTVTFVATTGHTLGNQWTSQATTGGYVRTKGGLGIGAAPANGIDLDVTSSAPYGGTMHVAGTTNAVGAVTALSQSNNMVILVNDCAGTTLGVLYRCQTDITATEINALNSAPLELVTAPPSGFVLSFISGFADYLFNTIGFDSHTINLVYTGSTIALDVPGVGDVFGAAVSSVEGEVVAQIAGAVPRTQADNKGVSLYDSTADLSASGAINANVINTGGINYVNGDTGTVNTGQILATYIITNAIAGVVQAGGYTITANGSGYATGGKSVV